MITGKEGGTAVLFGSPVFMLNETLTAQDVYQTALALTFTTEANAQDFRVFFLEFLNLCCAEALETENAIRRASGDMPELTAAPLLTELDQVIPYEDKIVRAALPYGVSSYFMQDDMDDYRYTEHRARFVSALAEAGRGYFLPVEAVYG